MNIAKKISWISLATLIVSSVFANSQDIPSYSDPCPSKKIDECDECYEISMGKPYKQGYEICEDVLPIAYNAPANIDICRGVDTYVSASFIYWQKLSDQLDLGRSRITSDDPQRYKAIKFSTEYEPGFKVGLGFHFNHDNWQMFAQYTRLHALEKTTYKPSTVDQGNFVSSWYITRPGTISFDDISSDGVRARWKMNLDKIDLELSRPLYVGTHLITTTFAGASNHWMYQSYDFLLEENTLSQHIFIKNDSWAIGPRLGIDTKWILYKRFSFFLVGSLSLMFAENDVSGSGNEDATGFELDKIQKLILRDVEELQIGFAWNSYFTNDKWY
ncbi:hypothetical protein LCGC14_2130040, partial [marine sediment metagenome]